MATAVLSGSLRRLIEPLRGMTLAAVTLIVWLLGALYCSGYERLAYGLDNWPSSLWWSAVAVLPWLALFEWSKRPQGRQALRSWIRLAVALFTVAMFSLLLEYAAGALAGDSRTPVLLAVMRRFPAIGTSLILILWVQAARVTKYDPDPELDALAASIDWLSAADNYVELRIGGRVAMRRMTMREAEKALASHGFIRVHRRFLVNRRKIAEIRPDGRAFVRMADGTDLPVGQAYRNNLSFAH